MSGSSRNAPRKAGGKRLGMHADFAVVHQAVFAFVDKFNRVFQRDDVVFAVAVRIIHHRRERRGFAGAGRPGDDDQAAVQHGEFFQHRRQRRVQLFKILKRQHAAGNLPEHGADAVFLVEKIHAEARDVRDFVAEVHVAGFLERFDFVIRRDFVEHRLERRRFPAADNPRAASRR